MGVILGRFGGTLGSPFCGYFAKKPSRSRFGGGFFGESFGKDVFSDAQDIKKVDLGHGRHGSDTVNNGVW